MRKRTFLLWKKILARLAVAVGVFAVLYIYLYTGFLTIQKYEITGTPDSYVPDLKKEMASLAEQKLYKVLPGNRVISYHDDALRALVMDTLPNTKSISIRPSGLHSLSLKVESHTPLFSVGDGYAISRDGSIYKEIIPLDDYARLEIASTTQVAPATLVAISGLSKKLEAVLFKIGSISIDEYGDIRLYNEKKSSYVIIASASDEDKVWSNILSAVDTNPLKKSLEDNLARLDYIDARFGNKIFYKFTNGNKIDIIRDTQDHATSTPPAIQ